ncbi:MAG: RNA polymerase sigma factor [Verrucomicrobia bacterium]|nr:RNA polymerase sigma factor [Verrucomicrobiota bacterium]
METPSPTPPATPALEPREFAAVYETYSRPVYYLALRLLGDASEAEDAAHDVFLKVFRHLGEFRGESRLRTWLYRITINHCRNRLQTWQRRHIGTVPDDRVWDNLPSPADSPLRLLETKELGQRIQQTLDALPEEYRLLLLLVADERLSYEQVAELTHQTADAVRGKLHRARRAFAVEFSKTA